MLILRVKWIKINMKRYFNIGLIYIMGHLLGYAIENFSKDRLSSYQY